MRKVLNTIRKPQLHFFLAGYRIALRLSARLGTGNASGRIQPHAGSLQSIHSKPAMNCKRHTRRNTPSSMPS